MRSISLLRCAKLCIGLVFGTRYTMCTLSRVTRGGSRLNKCAALNRGAASGTLFLRAPMTIALLLTAGASKHSNNNATTSGNDTMNVFAVSNDPVACARALDDRRLIKMVLETAQIICTATSERRLGVAVPYKSTHKFHPCVIWAQTDSALLWMCTYFEELCKEYTLRFEKTHKCAFLMSSPVTNIRARLSHAKQTPETFANCASKRELGIDYKGLSDTHKAYQLYLVARWSREITSYLENSSHYSPRWTNVQPPVWIIEALSRAQQEALASTGPRRAARRA